MTIYQIKEATKETAPFFFTKETLKFFGQTMSSFSVKKQPDGRYLITASMKDRGGVLRGETKRYFNPENNKLEFN
jgi:hypothetical protein